MIGPLLTHWTIRLALACYVGTLLVKLVSRDKSRWWPVARTTWTVGCLLFLAHVVCAFWFYHRWSHTHAYNHTADVTGSIIGWRFGAGIYFSYLFTLLWTADTIWWWVRPKRYNQRSATINILIHAYILFIAFNGAIIFEGGPVRWAGIAACLLLAAAGCFWNWKPSAFAPER